MGIKILEIQAKKGMTEEDIKKGFDEILKEFQKEESDVLENSDNINNPQHYKLNGLDVESIDVVRSVLGKDGQTIIFGRMSFLLKTLIIRRSPLWRTVTKHKII